MKIKISIFFILITLAVSTSNVYAQSKKRPKIGLVLSGGGSKGIAHIGVIRVLESRGIKPDYIVGTSFGALVAGFYSMGYTPDEMEEIISTNDWDYLLNDEIKRKNVLIGQSNKDKNSIIGLPLDGLKPALSSGLYPGQNILTFFEIKSRAYCRDMDFDNLPIPFRCISTNIETGEEKIFKDGNIAEALRASLSIPSVFNPFEIDGELYVDGGLVNNFPTDVVKAMGADIIIGVDVGAVLYKKEEINSIIKILDQTSSFYNYRVAQKNKKLCDIYIRPNIDGISSMTFDKTEEIIKRGYDATIDKLPQIDSIFNKYNLSPILHDSIPKINKIIKLDTIVFKTTIANKHHQKGACQLLKGKLNLTTPCTITEQELADKINKVYGSKYFKKVSMNFIPNDTSYTLVINVKDRQINNFNIGARYDNTYGVNLLLSAQFRNLLIYGSLTEIGFTAGQSPQFKLRYTTDRGENIGFGSSLNYTNFSVNSYQNSVRFATYNYNYAALDLFIHSYIGGYNRIIVGLNASAFSLKTNQTISDIGNILENYLSPYVTYIIDTWDRAYYPNKGFKFKTRGDLIINSEYNNMPTVWARAILVSSISKKIKIITEGFMGFSDLRLNSSLFRFEVGGMEKNRIQWYNSFPGLQFLEHGSTNLWLVKVSPRYEFYKNNFLTFTFGIVGMDIMPDRLFSKPHVVYKGMGIKYGFYSMFGPMEISTDFSFDNFDKNVFVSLGYWF